MAESFAQFGLRASQTLSSTELPPKRRYSTLQNVPNWNNLLTICPSSPAALWSARWTSLVLLFHSQTMPLPVPLPLPQPVSSSPYMHGVCSVRFFCNHRMTRLALLFLECTSQPDVQLTRSATEMQPRRRSCRRKKTP